MRDQLWCASHYHLVHERLGQTIDNIGLAPAPGTGAAIDRAIDHFRAHGKRAEVGRLERLSVHLVALEHALRDGRVDEAVDRRHALKRLAFEWLAVAPMFPDAAPRPQRLRLAA